MALGVLACGAMSSASRLSPLRHQPTIGTFASSMADAEEQRPLSARVLPGSICSPARGTEVPMRPEENASIYRKNLLKSQKVSVKPILMRSEVMSGA